jgi:23S rRNA pseudouridine2605 synthase
VPKKPSRQPRGPTAKPAPTGRGRQQPPRPAKKASKKAFKKTLPRPSPRQPNEQQSQHELPHRRASEGRGEAGRPPRKRSTGRPVAGGRPSGLTEKRGYASRVVARGDARAQRQPTPEPATLPQGRDGAPVAERLQKVLAAAGIGSRRQCEELITTGRVEVDRQTVTELGTKVDPNSQEIRVDGERLPSPKRVVYMVNKPVGVVTTNYDPSGRPRVIDLLPGDRRLFAVGRLDRSSEGLILVTNDGDLANRLAHPRYGVEKTYLVQVAGVPTQETLDTLRRGMHLSDGRVQAKRVVLRSSHKASAVLEMVLDEGRNREVRRMLAACGHKVQQLKRISIGPLPLGQLLPGQYRPLTWTELRSLEAASGGAREPATPARSPRTGRHGEKGRPNPRSSGRLSRQADQHASAAKRRPRRPGKASSWRQPRGGKPE